MKKTLVFSFIFLTALSFVFVLKAQAQTAFIQALKNCGDYSQTGSIKHKNEVFDVAITLNKKGNKCVYKEKIFQGKEYEMLTCNFESAHLPFMVDSMERFSKTFEKQIAKNRIFEAKMTTNGEIFQKYLVDPNYCQITHSKKQ